MVFPFGCCISSAVISVLCGLQGVGLRDTEDCCFACSTGNGIFAVKTGYLFRCLPYIPSSNSSSSNISFCSSISCFSAFSSSSWMETYPKELATRKKAWSVGLQKLVRSPAYSSDAEGGKRGSFFEVAVN